MIKVIDDNNEKYQYKINYGTLSAINKFKNFVGQDKFQKIIESFGNYDLPLEEEQYEQLLEIIIEERPESIKSLKEVPYHHAGELLTLFCEPLVKRFVQQVQSTMNTTSSLLHNMDPEAIKTMMESTGFLKKNGTDTAAEN